MPRRSAAPSRRALLLLGLTIPLAGCSVRLERDAPALPGLPTAEPPVDADLMQQTITRLRAIAASLDGAEPPAWTSKLRTLHLDQADALTRLAASDGISVTATAAPTSTATTTGLPPSTTGSGSASPKTASSSSSSTTVHRSGEWEAAELSPARFGEVVGASDRHRPALLAVLAGHRAGARVLGQTGSPPVVGLAAADAVTVLSAVRTATYAAEVLVAKTAFRQRSPLSSLLTVLYAERMRLGREADKLAPPEQLSYALPNGSDDPAKAREVLAPMLVDCVHAAASTTGRWKTEKHVTRGVQLWGDLTALAWQWGQTPDTFLGLKQ